MMVILDLRSSSPVFPHVYMYVNPRLLYVENDENQLLNHSIYIVTYMYIMYSQSVQ